MPYSTIPITSGSAKFSTLDPDADLFLEENNITVGPDPENPTTIYDNQKNEFTSYSMGSVPAGSVLIYGGASTPAGFLLCNGAAVSRSDYDRLFQIIGTTYGAGDGSTTFNLPDLRGKVVIGVSGSHAIGTTGGAETVTLTAQQIPAHSHTVDIYCGTGSGSSLYSNGSASTTKTYTSSSIGGGQSHNNMQPFQTLNYIIKT